MTDPVNESSPAAKRGRGMPRKIAYVQPIDPSKPCILENVDIGIKDVVPSTRRDRGRPRLTFDEKLTNFLRQNYDGNYGFFFGFTTTPEEKKMSVTVYQKEEE